MPVIPPLVAAVMEYLGLAVTAGAVLDAGLKAFETHSGDAAKVAEAVAKASKTKISAAEKRAAVREGMAAARAAEAAAKESKRIMPKVKGVAGTAMTGLFALSMLPMLKDMLGGEESPQQMGGMGGEDQLAALLSGLQEQAASSSGNTAEDFYQMQGSNRVDQIVNRLGTRETGFGIRPDLDEIIRGNEDQIARISSVQPITFAEAMAKRGIFTTPGPEAAPLEGLV